MLLWDKMDLAMKQFHKNHAEKEALCRKQYADEGRKLEKGDLPAMLISAFLIIVPAVLLAVLFMVGAAYFLLLH